jgi:hypothetical protein
MTSREVLEKIQELLNGATKEQREMILSLLCDLYCFGCGDEKTACSCAKITK